jgi:hypothetical protein
MVTDITGVEVRVWLVILIRRRLLASLQLHAEFRPAPLTEIAAFITIVELSRHDYRDDSHLLSIFAFGFGN